MSMDTIKQLSNEEKINDFAIDALSVLAKVLHALQYSNMKGTILHSEITAAVKKGMSCPLKITFKPDTFPPSKKQQLK